MSSFLKTYTIIIPSTSVANGHDQKEIVYTIPPAVKISKYLLYQQLSLSNFSASILPFFRRFPTLFLAMAIAWIALSEPRVLTSHHFTP